MINRQQLLADLQKFLKRIEADLLERSESTEVPEVQAALHVEYEKAAKAERTAQNYEDWRTDTITQAAAAWVLSCVFVRFLEDNSLIDPPKIAGPGDRLERARDEYDVYFRSHPQHTDREYLLSLFSELAKLPGTRDIFGEHNAINDLPNWLSGDAAGELMNFFQKIDASTGDLVHDFTDPNWDTRFLGDLYQDLSEAARKKFALLQTPDFVEEFILDRTLEPALDEFGLVIGHSSFVTSQSQATNDKGQMTNDYFKMIDPACGSGHFLLGAFPRLLDRWRRKEPGTNIRALTQQALDGIHGVDINPFAVAIAKFRLLLVAMKSCDIRRLVDAPAFQINVACGDSLLHGENRTSTGQKLWEFAEGSTDEELYSHAYPGEDLQTVRTLLRPGTYHCVVANPPYIVCKDRKVNDWYRKRFSACGGKYSLAVPFMQQIFQLAINEGFTGQITANSFMNNEFGKKLVVHYLPTIDLTTVVDSRYVKMAGHGTPTVILFGRNRAPTSSRIRVVMAIRGEANELVSATRNTVWENVLKQVDQLGSESDFFSVADLSRDGLKVHPWTIGGGGAAELKQLIASNAHTVLAEVASIGVCLVTLEDEAFQIPKDCVDRVRIHRKFSRGFVDGNSVRDWQLSNFCTAIFPHDSDSFKPVEDPSIIKFLWVLKPNLCNRLWFERTQLQRNLRWFEYGHISVDKFRTPTFITFAYKATHNHFVLNRSGYVFNRTAPVIKLHDSTKEEDYCGLVGLLNSSTIAFWERQVHRWVSGPGEESWESRLERNATKLDEYPISTNKPVRFSELLVRFANEQSNLLSVKTLTSVEPIRANIQNASTKFRTLMGEMIAAQENLDWECYKSYGIVDESLTEEVLDPTRQEITPVMLGQRAFEIVLARRIAAGETQSTWFERHGSRPITELPLDWPVEYRTLVERRIELIENNPNIRLIEQPEYKRRWNLEPWESQLERVLREWLLLRLETYFDFDDRMIDEASASKRPVPLGEIAMYSVAQLADAARRDSQFMEVGELYRDDPAFDVQALIEELVLAESVPHLPILRYKDSGLRKRAEWEKTWDLQRREDAGESVGTIPVPPKYISADFISTGGARYWSLRGKLDVPKERWISFPHCEGPDGTLVICWAGYDHQQQAQAISAYYVRVQTEFGGSDDPRLIPLLASLIELLPWLKQWHNEPNANFDGLRMGDYFEGFVNEEARNLGKTLAEIKAWVPPKKATKASKNTTKKGPKKTKSLEVGDQ
jgi:hypothetical protein